MKTVNQNNILQKLKDTARFCCWRYETIKGRQTKVPYDPVTGHKAKNNQPTTFTAFDTAVSRAGYNGIGIRVADGIVGIDLNHCVENGTLLPWAQEIVDIFRKSASLQANRKEKSLRCLQQGQESKNKIML